MRIVDRQELMTLPEGTVYQKITDREHYPLMVKKVTITLDGINQDWFKCVFGPYYSKDDLVEIDNTISRDGCFDDKAKYLVLESHDVILLMRKLQRYLKIDPLPDASCVDDFSELKL